MILHLCPLWFLLCSLVVAQGQPPMVASTRRDAITLDVDSVAVKKLGAVRDLIAAQQWRQAIDLLNQIATQHGDKLTPSGPNRFVSVATQCQLLLTNLPADGLRVYREQMDPQVQPWLRDGIANHDEELLGKIVRQAFASSHTDDSLLWLGEIAFARGEFSRARACWESILPLSHATPPPANNDSQSIIHNPPPTILDPRPLVLTYPDTDLDPTAVRARLVLCSLFERDFGRAKRELRDFSRLHPTAEGTLAGRRGVFAEILADVAQEMSASGGRQPPGASDQEPVPKTQTTLAGDLRPPLAETHGTFAGAASRQFVAQQSVDVRGPAWVEPVSLAEQVVTNYGRDPDPFPWRRFDPEQSPSLPASRVLSYFPVVTDRVLLVGDERSVSAFDLTTGRAAWGDDPANGVIYELPDDPPRRTRGRTAGVPAFTLTVSGGRAFARLGSPVTARTDDLGLDRVASHLVCLDVARGEGKLVWSRDAVSFEPPSPLWSFEGTPVAVDGRLFVALRQGSARPQMFVACLDAETGRTIWLRRVGIAEASLAGHYHEISHQLVTVADGGVFYNTNAGAIVALGAADGAYRWVATYPRVEPESQAEFNARRQLGPNPCVVDAGTGVVFASPYDAGVLLALDSASGLVLWSRELRTRPRAILGVGRGPANGDRTLVIQTDQMWGLDAETGRVRWQVGDQQSQFRTHGRGALAGDTVVCPTREEIWIVDQATGALRRRLRLADDHRESGGNVLIAPDRLIIAGSNRMTVFGPSAPGTEPRRPRLLSNRTEIK
ncbi:MAG: PQQ-like beta-propeller repeat protein [Planctomycetales bacterium]|nr:PQQ-like beta-propeller repeat protein [Planctomycetales bacterium]